LLYRVIFSGVGTEVSGVSGVSCTARQENVVVTIRLCDLFASGRMEHAKEIARLLVEEIQQARPDPEALASSE
jgi:hypothetical protein